MALDWLGWPQIAALLLLAQRGLEELYSARNTRKLLAEGGHEEGRDYYPVVAVTHLGWIASIFFLIPADAPISWLALVLYGVLRYLYLAHRGDGGDPSDTLLRDGPLLAAVALWCAYCAYVVYR